MTDSSQNSPPVPVPDPVPKTTPKPPGKPVAKRWSFIALGLAFLFVLMPFLFWRSTWFGLPLSDAEISEQLTDAQHPRKIQHALSQIADRILRGDPARRPGEPWRPDPAVRQWYPQVAVFAAHPVPEIRLTAAWVMGQDNTVPEFHAALLTLLRDPDPMVRRNAALSLVRFNDATGHDEILSMLSPYHVTASLAGTLDHRLQPGDVVNPHTLLGHILVGEEKHELRSPVPGAVERWLASENAAVAPDQEIISISPSAEVVFEALRALTLIGRPDDLPEIQRYARGVPGMPPALSTQAKHTAATLHTKF